MQSSCQVGEFIHESRNVSVWKRYMEGRGGLCHVQSLRFGASSRWRLSDSLWDWLVAVIWLRCLAVIDWFPNRQGDVDANRRISAMRGRTDRPGAWNEGNDLKGLPRCFIL